MVGWWERGTVGVLVPRWEDPYNGTKQLFPGVQLQDIRRAGLEEGKGGRWGLVEWSGHNRQGKEAAGWTRTLTKKEEESPEEGNAG